MSYRYPAYIRMMTYHYKTTFYSNNKDAATPHAYCFNRTLSFLVTVFVTYVPPVLILFRSRFTVEVRCADGVSGGNTIACFYHVGMTRDTYMRMRRSGKISPVVFTTASFAFVSHVCARLWTSTDCCIPFIRNRFDS
jgi:hypothetical protein